MKTNPRDFKITWLDKIIFWKMKRAFKKEMKRDQDLLDAELEITKTFIKEGKIWQK